jgi:hypothetical protein
VVLENISGVKPEAIHRRYEADAPTLEIGEKAGNR